MGHVYTYFAQFRATQPNSEIETQSNSFFRGKLRDIVFHQGLLCTVMFFICRRKIAVGMNAKMMHVNTSPSYSRTLTNAIIG